MKKFTILCAIVFGLGCAAFAASVDTINVRFATPVVVGESTLPAGNVTITVQHEASYVLLTFRTESGMAVSAVATRISDIADETPDAKVVLSHNGVAYKIERILLNGHTGFALAQ